MGVRRYVFFDLLGEDIDEAINEAGNRELGVLLTNVVKSQKSKFCFPSWKNVFFLISRLLTLDTILAVGFGAQRIAAFHTRFRI